MADVEKVGLREMGNGTIEVVPGLVIDQRLKLSGIRKMEIRFGVPFHRFKEIKIESVGDMVGIILILAQQRDAAITEAQVEAALDRVDVGTAMRRIDAAFSEALKVEAKNSDAPNPAPAA